MNKKKEKWQHDFSLSKFWTLYFWVGLGGGGLHSQTFWSSSPPPSKKYNIKKSKYAPAYQYQSNSFCDLGAFNTGTKMKFQIRKPCFNVLLRFAHQLTLNHGFQIRWLLISRCARMKENGSFRVKIPELMTLSM